MLMAVFSNTGHELRDGRRAHADELHLPLHRLARHQIHAHFVGIDPIAEAIAPRPPYRQADFYRHAFSRNRDKVDARHAPDSVNFDANEESYLLYGIKNSDDRHAERIRCKHRPVIRVESQARNVNLQQGAVGIHTFRRRLGAVGLL